MGALFCLGYEGLGSASMNLLDAIHTALRALSNTGGRMSGHSWLTDAQGARQRPLFWKGNGKPIVDGMRVLGSIIYIKKIGCSRKTRPPRWPTEDPLKPDCTLFARGCVCLVRRNRDLLALTINPSGV